MNKCKISLYLKENKNILFATIGCITFSALLLSSVLLYFLHIRPMQEMNNLSLVEISSYWGVQFQQSEFSGFNIELFIFIITIVIAAIGIIGLVLSIVFLVIVSIKRRRKIKINFDEGQEDFTSTDFVDNTLAIETSNDKGLS